MAILVRYIKTIRRNWKKSTFGLGLVLYGSSSMKNKYDINVFMKACCKEAENYGNELLPAIADPRSITVILNPAANKKSAKDDYEKYCEPLFHMAGIMVNLVQTNGIGHAKELVENVPKNEPVVIAGGDGTLSEALTGLLRQSDKNDKRIIGILPVGRMNHVGNEMFPLKDSLPKVRQLTNATMAIIKNQHELKDVMKIEVISEETEKLAKPIYALGGLEWGAFRDAKAKRDKYWVYGNLRNYVTYIFNGYKSSLCWECKGLMKYSPPCSGCNNCQCFELRKPKSFRMLDLIMPKTHNAEVEKDFSAISNDNCGFLHEKIFKSVSVNISLTNATQTDPSHLSLSLGKPQISYLEFISEGWKRLEKSVPTTDEFITARTIEILPEKSSENMEMWYEIDNEEYDVKPIRISVYPRAINMFCNKEV